MQTYTISLRQQLIGHGVEVVELMPPAVRTNLHQFPEGGQIEIMSTDELVTATIQGLRAGAREIRPGQANQLYWMSRLAPGFMATQMAKSSARLLPPPKN